MFLYSGYGRLTGVKGREVDRTREGTGDGTARCSQIPRLWRVECGLCGQTVLHHYPFKAATSNAVGLDSADYVTMFPDGLSAFII